MLARNSAAAESEGGQKFLPRRVAKRLLRGFPLNPFPRTRTRLVRDFAFCLPDLSAEVLTQVERSVSAVPPTAGAISRSFVQKRFELRSAIATKLDILSFQVSNYKIGSNFKKLRAQKGYSLEKVVRLADLSLNTVVHLELGTNRNPTIETLTKIARALDVSVDDLLK